MFGSIYSLSWWGNTNEANGWGSIYPFDADGSIFSADTTKILSDTTLFKADQTVY